MTIGLIVLVAFSGAGTVVGRSTFSDVFDIVAGVAAIGFAAGVQRGGLSRRRERDRPHGRATSALAVRLRRPSTATAAFAGVATHVPGLIYIVALNLIAAGGRATAAAFTQVLIYNLLWFAIPLAALTLAIRSPEAARVYLDRATAFAQRHQERLLVLDLRGARRVPHGQGRRRSHVIAADVRRITLQFLGSNR